MLIRLIISWITRGLVGVKANLPTRVFSFVNVVFKHSGVKCQLSITHSFLGCDLMAQFLPSKWSDALPQRRSCLYCLQRGSWSMICCEDALVYSTVLCSCFSGTKTFLGCRKNL